MRTSTPYLVSLLKQGLLPDFIFLCREVKKAESQREGEGEQTKVFY